MRTKKIIKRSIQGVLYVLRNILDAFFPLQEVSVLVYHSISSSGDDLSVRPEVFEEQINFLKRKGYHFATLNEIVSWIKGEGALPHKTVATTFDDGYADNYKDAFPLLKKYNVPTTIFTVTNPAGIKRLAPGDISFLNKEQMEEMSNSGLAVFQSHSVSHKMLDDLNPKNLEDELARGDSVYFAYPGGHYNDAAIIAVRLAGYEAAFSIKPGLVHIGDEVFMVRRNVILGSMSLFDFKVRASKAIDWYTRLAFFLKKLFCLKI